MAYCIIFLVLKMLTVPLLYGQLSVKFHLFDQLLQKLVFINFRDLYNDS